MTPEEIEKLPYRPCVGVMLVNAQGLIFAGQRIDSETPAWQMPQGGIDPGEDPEAAALRELREETGVSADLVEIEARTPDWLTYDLPHELVPRVWKGRYRGQKQLWFLLRFKGSDADIRIDTEHPEFSAWRWIGPEEMIDSIVPFKKDIYRAVVRAFRDRLAG
ncbi:RNA pyrophosphohydrolase [Pseudoruegeria aquimaris]|uniref:RNA pyrophosphohydrolase n=1 Tax=Pseudoruegeria aquimaris TaxID=393663 RepID=A0A1Y5RZJ3_9RHOB|nr:RNA pyrophosphohydrolase [Pseudoruegeria aquimaris]SLN28564.1 RNA pyrophosphohydrolase [Pseudoruegeria aquimaris]